jgi:hypothetical protein
MDDGERELPPPDSADATAPSADAGDPALAAERARAIAEADWKAISERLLPFAQGRHRRASRWKDPKDFVQEAIAKGLASGFPRFDPRKESLEEHLRKQILGDLSNERTRAENSGSSSTVKGPRALDFAPSNEASPEKRIAQRELFEKCRKPIEARFRERGAAYMLVALDAREEQAADLGITVKQMYRLQEDIVLLCKKLEKELGVDALMERRDPERVALERNIEAVMPSRVKRTGWYDPRTWILAVLCVAVIAVAWRRCGR